MFKATAHEITICSHCGEEIDYCSNCRSSFFDDDKIYCDEIKDHFCKSCGKPKYNEYKL